MKEFNEPAINVNCAGTVSFSGGYDASWLSNAGMTTLQGVLTVTNGQLIVGNLIIM
ncbi:MAG TPA: hypothetical protein VK187_12325 [Geobacteraceae bacterium]|nr:hypothetical protein [Geobacteraceae bacterium]